MEIQPVYRDIFEDRYRQIVRDRVLKAQQSEAVQRRGVVDMVVFSQRQFVPVVPAQDPGELKHVLDKPVQAVIFDSTNQVNSIEQIAQARPADYAHRYVVPPINAFEWRKRLENIVRRIKKSRQTCPYCDENNQCIKVTIRCGERTQLAIPETKDQQQLPHLCNYRMNSGPYVLIVDRDKRIREFCANALSLFLGYNDEKFLFAGSVAESIDVLRKCKISKQQFGLVISDVILPGRSGLDIVQELFERNYNVDIILMKETASEIDIPTDHVGNIEIVQGQKMIRTVLNKPFHSEELVKSVQEILDTR